MFDLPLVSIVTPSYNMREYLRDALESILSQDYPRIECVVVDGGSTDGTPELLKSYNGRVRWVSQPDDGAADAINRGFAMCRGDVFAWLNADDWYFPGAIARAVQLLGKKPEVDVLYGRANWVDDTGRVVAAYPTRPFDPDWLRHECFICQPAAFLRARAFRDVGGLDTSLSCSFDYDLWIRLADSHGFAFTEEYFASSRMHASNKTLGRRQQVFEETIAVLARHYGYVPFRLIYSYFCYKRDGRDQFYDVLRPSLSAYVMTLPAGLRLNRAHPLRYVREWGTAMSFEGLLRTVRRQMPGGSE